MNTVLITACNRGIGLEFADQYARGGWQVHATCRNPASATELNSLAERYPSIHIHQLDVVDREGIDALANELSSLALDLLIHNAGVYPSAGRRLDSVESTAWLDAFRVNTIAPALITRALLPQLDLGRLKTVAILSSKVGSIEDNGSGGSYAYRSSKTAVNQVMKSLSIDLAPQGYKVVSLHPGWVQTEMGGPNALIGTAESVSGMRRVLEQLTHQQTGKFFNFDGSAIPW